MEAARDQENFNPFQGLRPFSSCDSKFFFGRKTESREVISKLLKNRYISVIGAAGTGKSSLIYGGVAATFNDEITDGPRWNVISFRPGNNPFGNLADALSKWFLAAGNAKADSNQIMSELSANSTSLTQLRKKYLNSSGNVLLIIDQLEDLFRFQSSENQGLSAKFIEFLVTEVTKGEQDLFFVLTMRSEYLGECSHHWELARLINSSNYIIPEPGFENWKEVIEEPVKISGSSIAPELVDLLLNDIRNSNYQLSVFQHVMMRMWNVWKKSGVDRSISISDYNTAGTIKKSVSDHADEIFESLTEREKEICTVLFKAVTRKGSDNKGIRHPSDIKTIKSIAGSTEDELRGVIQKFSHSSCSFVSFQENLSLFENSTVDIQNECLIQTWDLLKDWIDNEASSMQMYLRLSEASALYQQGKTGLFKTPDLQSAIKWRNQNNPALTWAVQYNPAFERAMVYLRTSEKAYEEEEENKIKQEKTRKKRAQFNSKILGIVILIACGLTVYSYVQRVNAERKATQAENARMLLIKQKARADSTVLIAFDQKSVSDSIAEAAIKNSEEAEAQKILSENQKELAEKRAIQASYQKEIAVGKSKDFERLRLLSIGKSMSLKSLQLTGQKDLQMLLAYQAYLFTKKNTGPENDPDIYAGLYNVDILYGGINYKSFKGHTGAVKSMAFVPGKKEFYTSGSDGKVLKWDLDKKDETLQVVYSGSDIIEVLAVSPDESWLACGSNNASIRMIPLKGNTIGYEMAGHKGGVKSLIFSYDGKYLYSAALDGKVLKWDIAARTSVNVATGMMEITSLDISSKGNFLAGLSNDGNVMVWNPEQNSENFKIGTAGKNIKVVRFNPANNLLALGDANGNIEIWDIERHKKISEIKAHDSQINDIRFNARLDQMATAGNDRKIKLFNIKNPTDLSDPPVIMADNDEFVLVMQFSPDGQMIISGETGGPNNLLARATNADFLAKDICGQVSRNMTQEEWNAYVAKDIPLEKTCQVKSLNIKVEPISSLRK
jgi:WD40 repeat protein